VTSAGFSFISNSTLAAGQVVAAMAAAGGTPTSWAITGGNARGNYAINNAGVITLTAAGAINLFNQTSTDTLTVQASNAGGSSSGTATIAYQPALVAPPVVTSASFSLTTNPPLTVGQVIGTMTATSSAPLSWSLTAGDTTDFMIDSHANIKLTTAGTSNLINQAGTTTLTVQATNSGGSGIGTATINYNFTLILPQAPTGLTLSPM
jgi:hypothetical protein